MPSVAEQRDWGGSTLHLAGRIEAIRSLDGTVAERMPQGSLPHEKGYSLHKYGSGPFADLVVPVLPPGPGVYVVAVNDRPVYAGRAAGLRERWGPRGYSRIHRRNCFTGGQPTNCKVNASITRHLMASDEVTLWTLETSEFIEAERRLLDALTPPWNGRQRD